MSLSESQSHTVTLSGRELALRRRRAMSSVGKSAVRSASHKSSAGSEHQRKSAQNLDQAAGQNWPFNPMPVRESQASESQAHESQAHESQAHESQAHEACGPECGCDSNKSEPAVRAGGALVRNDISSRTLARMRREAASKTGKAGQQRVAKAVQVAQHLPASQLYSALSSGPSGRQVAMQRRLQQALLGRAGHRQLASNSSISSSQSSSSIPAAKVEIGHTLSGQLVTGQLPDNDAKVTGNLPGLCQKVTGTEYLSVEPFKAFCSQTPNPKPRKVSVMSIRQDLAVTGADTGGESKVTGDARNFSVNVTGTDHMVLVKSSLRPSQSVSQLNSVTAVRPTHATIPASSVTGERPGAGGERITGDERGACQPISGTPYLGDDNSPSYCRPHPAERSSKPRERREQADKKLITGSSFQTERITGVLTKADGVITGTPEFRHADPAPRAAADTLPLQAAQRVTGEGSQSGTQVTGDAWHSQSRVTGTEGGSVMGRNPSMRGQSRGQGMNASQFKGAERQTAPQSPITGSAGNTGRGAVVTVSGGARG